MCSAVVAVGRTVLPHKGLGRRGCGGARFAFTAARSRPVPARSQTVGQLCFCASEGGRTGVRRQGRRTDVRTHVTELTAPVAELREDRYKPIAHARSDLAPGGGRGPVASRYSLALSPESARRTARRQVTTATGTFAHPPQAQPTGTFSLRKPVSRSVTADGRSRLGRWPAHGSSTWSALASRCGNRSAICRKSARSYAPDRTRLGA